MRRLAAVVVLIAAGAGVYFLLRGAGPASSPSPPVAAAPPVSAPEPEPEAVPEPEPEAEPADDGVVVEAVEGSAARRVSGEEAWQEVFVGDRLAVADSIRTGERSSVQLRLGQTATVDLGPRSEASPAEITAELARLRLLGGRVKALVREEAGGELVVDVVETGAVARARSGAFAVLTEGGEATVAAIEGGVRVEAEGEAVEVAAGEQSLVGRGSAPAPPTRMPTSLFLKVARPSKSVQREKVAAVRGESAPGAVVTVNGVRVTAGADGVFEASVPLTEGQNVVQVVAENVLGQVTETTLDPITVKTRVSKVESEVRWGAE